MSNNENHITKNSIIFIDDDELLRVAWTMVAEKSGINIFTYSNAVEFINEMNIYSKDIPIYIDSELGEETKGEEYAKKIFDFGFREIFLTTGYDPERFVNMPWIKAVVDKMPPF